MSNVKIARSFRLDPEVIDKIEKLQKFYSDRLGVKVSQADTLKFAVNTEFNSIDKLRKMEV